MVNGCAKMATVELGFEGVVSVPLSEEEQRILHEIERSFYERDPDFAKGVSKTTLYRHAGRNCKWAALTFGAGLALVVASFATLPIVGFLGFLVMLGSTLVFERNLRKVGRAGWQEMTQSVRSRGFPDVLSDTRKRLRQRFRRKE
jgi:hypothetical protein